MLVIILRRWHSKDGMKTLLELYLLLLLEIMKCIRNMILGDTLSNNVEYHFDSFLFRKAYHEFKWARSKCVQMRMIVCNVLHNPKKV